MNDFFLPQINHPAVERESLRPCTSAHLLEFNGGNLPALERIEDLEAASLTNQEELFCWVVDYKCSLCGVELPPSFVAERQEHSDFHLAERLQEEESGDNHTSLPLKQRYYRICLSLSSLVKWLSVSFRFLSFLLRILLIN